MSEKSEEIQGYFKALFISAEREQSHPGNKTVTSSKILDYNEVFNIQI